MLAWTEVPTLELSFNTITFGSGTFGSGTFGSGTFCSGTFCTDTHSRVSVSPRNLGIASSSAADAPAAFQILIAHSERVLRTKSRRTSSKGGFEKRRNHSLEFVSTFFTNSMSSAEVVTPRASIHPSMSKSRSTFGSPQ